MLFIINYLKRHYSLCLLQANNNDTVNSKRYRKQLQSYSFLIHITEVLVFVIKGEEVNKS